MNTTYKKYLHTMRRDLGIKKILSIRFSNTKTSKHKKYQDTACTAMVRSLEKNIPTLIDRKIGQLCPGGNYFLNITAPPINEIRDTYVNREKVFQNNTVCDSFIKSIPKYPRKAEKRYILLTPLSLEEEEPDVIILLVNPAQTGRILGLNVFKKMSFPIIIPALSTCASIYAPLQSNRIHLNFIDYYDRYFQGNQNGKSIWKDHHMLVSMPFKIFRKIVESIPLSAHGILKPAITPQKVDRLR